MRRGETTVVSSFRRCDAGRGIGTWPARAGKVGDRIKHYRCLRLLRFRLFTASLCFFRYHRFPILSTYHMNVPASFAASLPSTSCLPSMLPLTTTAFLAKTLRQQWWRRFYCSNPSCIARTAGNSGLERLYRHPIRRFRSLRKTGR